MDDEWRIGHGWDIHRLCEGRRLVLGGEEIPFEKGLEGHSDADVLLHAVIDALLGAVAAGDIGTHFPDDDPTWRDAASVDLLRSVMERLRRDRWQVVNLDTTVIAEAPRIGPHRERMRATLARGLGVDVSVVSIKAKTAERLGCEGAGEAISAHAVVLLKRTDR